MTGMQIEKSDILREKSGKPYVKDSKVQFSISHSDNVWICAFSDAKVGIDFQFFKELDFDKIARRFFSGNENLLLSEKVGHEKKALFFEIWAKKEAAGKFFGTGIFKNGIMSINTVTSDLDGYTFIDEASLREKGTAAKGFFGYFVQPSEIEKVKKILEAQLGNAEFVFCVCAENKQVVEDIIEIGKCE